MDQLLLALMVWTSAQTGLPVPDELPEIAIEDRCEIERLFYGNAQLDCGESAVSVQAIYDTRHSRMVLPESWTAESIYDVSMLVHELVHHLQASAGVTPATVACTGREIEKPAYDAQIAWLEAAGLDAYETMGINGLAYHLLTMCESEARM